MANLPVGTTIYGWHNTTDYDDMVYTSASESNVAVNDMIYDIYGTELGTISNVFYNRYMVRYQITIGDNIYARTDGTSDDITTVQTNVKYISNLSDGTNTYVIKDAEARTDISNLATVATTGAYSDLTGQPTIPTVNNATLTITQGGTAKGTFTANASSNVTIDLDAGGGSTPSNMVTTDTAQTITGTKTFEGDSWITKIKNTTVTYNYAPASDVWTSIAFMDANDMQMGTVDCWRQPDNSTVMQLNVFGYAGYWGSNLGQSLQFGVDSSNNVFALAPNPRANPNGNEIATVGWIGGSSSDVVHKSNTETITGTKTFEGNQWITKFKNTTVAYNVAPVSGDVSTSIAFVDMYDNAMGTVDCWRYRDNSTEMDFGIFAANGAWISSTLKIYADANGNASAHAPTPPAGSNGDNIATTAWVDTAISGKQDVSNLVTSVSSSSTDSQYPSAKLFYDTCGDIETLINAL